MDENVIITSEHYNLKKYWKIVSIVCGVIFVLGLLLYLFNFNDCRVREGYSRTYRYSLLDNMLDPFSLEAGFFIDLAVLLFVLYLIITLILNSNKLVVTDKRVYGKMLFGLRIDLPVDLITAVSMFSVKAIAIATPSDRIIFSFIKNRNEIHSEICKLLIARQSKSEITTEIAKSE